MRLAAFLSNLLALYMQSFQVVVKADAQLLPFITFNVAGFIDYNLVR